MRTEEHQQKIDEIDASIKNVFRSKACDTKKIDALAAVVDHSAKIARNWAVDRDTAADFGLQAQLSDAAGEMAQKGMRAMVAMFQVSPEKAKEWLVKETMALRA